jgi:hypothetical protein
MRNYTPMTQRKQFHLERPYKALEVEETQTKKLIINEYASRGIGSLSIAEGQEFERQLLKLSRMLLDKHHIFRLANKKVKDELIEMTYEDLMDRLIHKKYDQKKARFSTYAGNRILGVITKYTRKSNLKNITRRNIANPMSLNTPISRFVEASPEHIEMIPSSNSTGISDIFLAEQLMRILSEEELIIAKKLAADTPKTQIGRELELSQVVLNQKITRLRRKLTFYGLTPELFNQN